MDSKTLKSGLIALTLGAATIAFADDAQELEQFLAANPNVQSAISMIEAETGGKVVDAEFASNGLVEVKIQMTDGTRKDMHYNLTDKTLTPDIDDDNDDSKHDSH